MRLPAAALLGAADAAALVLLRPDARALGRLIAAPRSRVTADPDGVLGQVAGAATWCLAIWLALGLLAAVASALPGTFGRLADRACRALLPRAIRGVLVGSAGLGVLLAPVAALAEDGPAVPGAVASLPAPAWPVSAVPRPPTTPTRSPLRHPATTPTSSTTSPARSPSVPAPVWPTARKAARTTPAVRVQRGDSLWLIAARRLGRGPTSAEVAAEWPRWYAANRAVVGADPDVIRPGQVLRAPADGGRPTPEEAAP